MLNFLNLMKLWEHWLDFLVGLWLVLSAFLGFSAYAMSVNLIISGLVIAIFSLTEGVRYNNQMEHMHS
jgi:hypothetical protein